MSADTPEEHPRRRVGDQGARYWALYVYRNLLPAAALVLAALALNQANGKSDAALRRANRATKAVADVEQIDRNAQRATSYRLCTRNKVDRAFAQNAVRLRRGRAAVRALQTLNALPVLDCTPNIHGRGARPLPPAEQDAFVARWARRELSAADVGVCPDSRIGSLSSVLICP